MATDVVRDLADTVIGSDPVAGDPTVTRHNHEDSISNSSAETVIRARDSANTDLVASSSYVVSTDDSVFSRDVDHWIRGDSLPSPIDTGVQSSRAFYPTTVQRSTLVNNSSSLNRSGVGAWCLAALILPFLSANNTTMWRCTPSTMIHTAELLMSQLARFCSQAIRNQIRSLAHQHEPRDVFATAMDIVLVIYAIGFLVLSLYQASIIGN